ncbi:MAG TPA: tetratricopeptide repeat protein [Candidatus Cybelea sp.]|nr:tetratricopeptide repeat protein [Candidatus Cybelea sp.]
MLGTLNPGEEAQLRQTIEMFEVITQSQPQDYQSLEILKEAYLKLSMENEVIQTSKRIAEAYVQLGQLSSAILEYETILQRHPEDADAMTAMAQIESKANNLTKSAVELEVPPPKMSDTLFVKKTGVKPAAQPEIDDGRQTMFKYFVDAKLIVANDFDSCWPAPSLTMPPPKTVEPFIHILSERQLMPVEKSLKVLADRSRLAYIPLDRYELDIELVRSAPREICQRWCVAPFDRMSKSIMIATANPFNKKAMTDLEESLHHRLLFYLASPGDLMRVLSKAFR